MIFSVPTRYEELTLLVKVRTYEPQKIRIKVIDAEQPNTTFTDRYKTINGESIFFVRMPVSAKEVLVYVYNEAYGSGVSLSSLIGSQGDCRNTGTLEAVGK